ncbi:MAG: hypothetical protein PHE89_01405 [Alphaproteobacteria bacterium]|nr:hypothetical protein [Alphaproteobacteria bacterium]
MSENNKKHISDRIPRLGNFGKGFGSVRRYIQTVWLIYIVKSLKLR